MTTYNYLWGKTDYSELPPDERLTQEIRDFVQWIEPTPDEAQIRYFTIMKYTNFIEYLFNNSDFDLFTKKGFKTRKYQVTVVGQGSSFINCFIPNSDIDLIILGLSDDVIVSDCLFKIVNQLWHSRLISNAIVLKHAKVPIAKIVDRQFGIHIDISIGQINGSLNVPRTLNYFQFYPFLRSILLIMKVFTLINEIHDPAKGGFGSNHMMLIIIFVIQQNPTIKTEGELLIAVLDFISSKMNIFLTGISTSDGGHFFPKFCIDFVKRIPHSIICQDPQYPDNYYGIRSKQSLLLVEKCKKALDIIESDLRKIEQTPVNPTTSNFFAKKKIDPEDSDYSLVSDAYSDVLIDDELEKSEDDDDDDNYSSDDVVEICGPSILGKVLIGLDVVIKRRREFKELAALWRLPPKEYNAKIVAREQTLQRSKSTPNLKKDKIKPKPQRNDERKSKNFDILKSKNFDKKRNNSVNQTHKNDNKSNQKNKSTQNKKNNQTNKNQSHPNQMHKNYAHDLSKRRPYDQPPSERSRNNGSNDFKNNRGFNRFAKDKKKPYKR